MVNHPLELPPDNLLKDRSYNTLMFLCLLSVFYACFEDGQPSVVDIQCAPGTILNIEEAGYGRSKWGLCRDLIKVITKYHYRSTKRSQL